MGKISFTPPVAQRVTGFMKPTVWHEFTPLAVKHQSCNLGQGFPDWEAPDFVKEAGCDSINNDFNQYSPSRGQKNLLESISETYSKHLNHKLDPNSEILVTVGVTEGLYATFQALINPGDEVIVLEPAFDIYLAQIELAGGTIRYLPLRRREGDDCTGTSRDFYIDWEELRGLVNEKTKAIIINSPHNPTGKVFNTDEMKTLSKMVLNHPSMIVLADDVYEHMIYDEAEEYCRIASLPGMFERTLTFSSAGKTFSVTGWKIGWIMGPKELITPIVAMQVWIPFSVCTPMQDAIANILTKALQPITVENKKFDSYYAWLRTEYIRKREYLVDALRLCGLNPIVPEGGFFIMADTSKMVIPEEYTKGASRDYAFCRWLTIEKGVTAIPPTAFFCDEHKPMVEDMARFAFCKKDTTLQEARRRLLE
eukprot:Nk52_evm17s2209 gene=Nk52_evmTU17s2209